MGGAANGSDVRAVSDPAATRTPGGVAAGAAAPGVTGAVDEGEQRPAPTAAQRAQEAVGAASPHVLQCALTMIGPISDPETGRPLGELLRAIGYL